MLLVLIGKDVNKEEIVGIINDLPEFEEYPIDDSVIPKNNLYDAALILTKNTITHQYIIDQILPALQPHAKISIRFVSDSNTIDTDMKTVETELKLSGLLSVEIEGLNVISGVKPNVNAVRRPVKPVDAKEALKALLTDPVDSSALINDSDLLLEEDLMKPEVVAEVCGPAAKKKACKDCTCGLKEEEAKGISSSEVIDTTAVKSSCGNVTFYFFPFYVLISPCFFYFYLVLFRRCFQMFRLSLSRPSSLQTR